MPGEMAYTLRWYGDNYVHRGDIASRKALMDITNGAIGTAKFLAYQDSGTMMRSIHAAPRGYDPGLSDFYEAGGGKKVGSDLAQTHDMGEMAPTQGLELGSWVPYAEIEEELRGRPFITPAVDMWMNRWEDYCTQRFHSEGLNDR